jgi:two-component system KDP operon response regulator KdpE
VNEVLILDADSAARRRTISAIRYRGFEARGVSSLRDASRSLRRHRFAALIIDPGAEAGAPQIIEELRAQTDAPLIAVSTCDEGPFKVALLDAGADDYMTRPLDPEELLARVRARIRRVASPERNHPIVTPDFTIYLGDRRLVRVDGTEPALSPTEWQLIEVLARHAGHLVTREELLSSVWGPRAVDKTQYLRVFMAGIRQKVEPDPPRPRYFVTIPGVGVLFLPEGRRPPAGFATGGAADDGQDEGRPLTE